MGLARVLGRGALSDESVVEHRDEAKVVGVEALAIATPVVEHFVLGLVLAMEELPHHDMRRSSLAINRDAPVTVP